MLTILSLPLATFARLGQYAFPELKLDGFLGNAGFVHQFPEFHLPLFPLNEREYNSLLYGHYRLNTQYSLINNLVNIFYFPYFLTCYKYSADILYGFECGVRALQWASQVWFP